MGLLKGKFTATDDLDMGGHHIRDWRYLADIPQGGAALGEALVWNGTQWIPGVVSGGGGGPVLWGDILDVPATFPPDDHTHVIADITDFDPSDYALVGHTHSTYALLVHQHVIADITDFDPDDYALASHTHSYTALSNKLIAGTGITVTNNHTIAASANYQKMNIHFLVDGGGAAIGTGIAGWVVVPCDGVITGCYVYASTNVTGSIQFDLWKDTYANYPPVDADSICDPSLMPKLVHAAKTYLPNLSTWVNTLVAGDVIMINVDSCTTVMKASVTLEISKT